MKRSYNSFKLAVLLDLMLNFISALFIFGGIANTVLSGASSKMDNWASLAMILVGLGIFRLAIIVEFNYYRKHKKEYFR